jgi:site-specific DNA recombinase
LTLEKAAIYIRVSTKKQVDKYSPQEQKRILIEYANSHQWEIFDYYSDLGESGMNSDREELDRLLVDAEKKHFDKVLLFEQDRLSRLEQIDWAYLANSLAKMGIKLMIQSVGYLKVFSIKKILPKDLMMGQL